MRERERELARESAVTLFGSHAPMRSKALLACCGGCDESPTLRRMMRRRKMVV